jgi:hypothetical protein
MCASNAALVDVDPAKERNRNNAQRIRFKFHGLRQMTRRMMVGTVEPFLCKALQNQSLPSDAVILCERCNGRFSSVEEFNAYKSHYD